MPLNAEEVERLPDAVKAQMKNAEDLRKGIAEGTLVNPVEGEQAPTNPQPQTPPATPQAQPPVEEPTGPEDYEHKYRVLKGKYDSEIADLNARIRRYDEQLDNLTEVLNTAVTTQQANFSGGSQGQPANAQEGGGNGGQPSTMAQQVAAGQSLNSEDFEGYGDEMVQAVNIINNLMARVNQLSSQVGEVNDRVTESAEDKYFGYLDDKVPSWRQLNRDTAFLGWLEEQEELSPYTRGQVLQHYAGQLNGPKVAQFFNKYLELQGMNPVQPGQETQPTTPSTPPQPGLEGQVLPDQGLPGTTPRSGPQVQPITKAQYEAYALQASRGEISEKQWKDINSQYIGQVRASLQR